MSNEIEQYKSNKISDINKFYNTRVEQRRQQYNIEYNSISKNKKQLHNNDMQKHIYKGTLFQK